MLRPYGLTRTYPSQPGPPPCLRHGGDVERGGRLSKLVRKRQEAMRGLWAITRKELYSYLVSPVAYAVAAAFLLINGLVFYYFISSPLAEASLQPILSSTVFILLLLTPILTMRLIAEERSTGTIELLMTFPVTDLQVVLGKFLATLITYALMLVPTLTYVVVIAVFGEPEVGILISAYLGLLLLGGAYIAVGDAGQRVCR